MTKPFIVYTLIDESPRLATASLLPILKAFIKHADINFITKDISLAGRILAKFSHYLEENLRCEDALLQLADLVSKPSANIIKLPNISASVSQLKAAIAELQSQGYQVPDYCDKTADRYAAVLGSAVNPVLREGNSDRRVAEAVKAYAKNHPHFMGEWSIDSKTHVSSMKAHDFYGSGQAFVAKRNKKVQIQFIHPEGQIQVLKEELTVDEGDLIDASFMSAKHLKTFIKHEIISAKQEDLLLSFHLKATMMKVSDPVIFSYIVEVYFKELFEKYRVEFEEIDIKPISGLADLYQKLDLLPKQKKDEILAEMDRIYSKQARLAMVDSDKGITNLHVSSDVIIDASMPAMIRNSGKMWAADGKCYDTKAIIPDRSYAGIYQEVISFCKEHGAFDPCHMGNVSNVGLMAKKAQEYGSHDKTFIMKGEGTVCVVDLETGKKYLQHQVEKGDIWRMCQTKEIAMRDWVKLAVKRAAITKSPAVFWLDENAAPDSELIILVKRFLDELNTRDLDIQILSPVKATRYTCERLKAGLDTISVTGNVLRDYLTDLFPILELGTSAKMLSIVPLLSGGSLYETGAGGSAPKLLEQLINENHLRWDSLGEFLATAASLEDMANRYQNNQIKIMADSLNTATKKYLSENKAPSASVKELDNRGSHFYLALYWSEALAQCDDQYFNQIFLPVFQKLKESEDEIIKQLTEVQGQAVDLGGYYHLCEKKLEKVMRPCVLFNEIIDRI